MILVTPDIRKRFHAAFKKARAERIRAVRLDKDLWFAMRREAGHGRYLIRFDVIRAVNGDDQVTVRCNSVDGERCKGTWPRKQGLPDRMCVHAATVIDRSIQYGARKEATEQRHDEHATLELHQADKATSSGEPHPALSRRRRTNASPAGVRLVRQTAQRQAHLDG